MCIRPIMTYGCQMWYQKTAKTHLKKLQIIQNKNLKIIFNLPRRYPTVLLHRNYNQNTINTHCEDLSCKFEERCRSSNFELLRNLYD